MTTFTTGIAASLSADSCPVVVVFFLTNLMQMLALKVALTTLENQEG